MSSPEPTPPGGPFTPPGSVFRVEAGDRFTCRTGSSTWDFTVGPDGVLTGMTR